MTTFASTDCYKFLEMKLTSVEIHNFKGFRHFSSNLTPGFNILIGRNGSGKTTFIDAVCRAVSFIFSSDKSLGDDFISAGATGLNIATFGLGDYYYDRDSRTYAPDVSVHASGSFQNESIDWTLYKRNAPNAALYQSKYKDAISTVLNRISTEGTYPLLAYFSDSYPHKANKLTSYPLETVKMDKMPRNFGYYQWDDEASCTSVWERRLCNRIIRFMPLHTPALRVASELLEFENSNFPLSPEENQRLQSLKTQQDEIDRKAAPLAEEIEYIEDKVKQFVSMLPLSADDGFEIDYFIADPGAKDYVFKIMYKNGEARSLPELPAGYRRLVSIVIDLAYRSYILNGPVDSAGIVLIDEIDLHLHPSLEEVVVDAFRKVFPAIQFIASTHSVAVISNLTTGDSDSDNQVLVFHNGDNLPEILPNLNGIDYNAALRDFMDTPSRNRNVKELSDKYLLLCSLGLENEARSVYDEITGIVGEQSPVLAELNTKRRNYDSCR